MGFRILVSVLYIIFVKFKVSNCFLPNVSRRSTPFVPFYLPKVSHKLSSKDTETTTKTRNLVKISTFEGWKKDMRDMFGVWAFFIPYDLPKAEKSIPNPDIRPTKLFFNPFGKVVGPHNSGSPYGYYHLDSKDYQHLDDENNYIYSRRLILTLHSGLNFSNLRLILAGRVFYSAQNLTPYLDDLSVVRPAIFLGQSFVQTFDNTYLEEATNRMCRKICMVDRDGNEINPKEWKPVDFQSTNFPFRWMYGTDSWRLVGPFTSYKSFGGRPWNANRTSLDPFDLEAVYNTVDPLELTCKKHTTLDDLEEVVHSVVRNLFSAPNPMADIFIQDEDYLSALEREMVTLGQKGPDYYREFVE